MAEIEDVVTGEVVAAEWGNQIRDRTVQRYIDADERDTLNPTPSGGDLAYLADIGVIQTFDGANWVAVGTGEFLPLDGGTVTGQLTIRRSSPNTFTIINEADGDLDGYRFQFRPNDGMEIRAGSPDNNPPVRVVYEMNIGEFVVHSGEPGSPFFALVNSNFGASTHDFRFNHVGDALRLQSSPAGTDTWTTLESWTAP